MTNYIKYNCNIYFRMLNKGKADIFTKQIGDISTSKETNTLNKYSNDIT